MKTKNTKNTKNTKTPKTEPTETSVDTTPELTPEEPKVTPPTKGGKSKKALAASPKPKAAAGKKMSALDAAAQVLAGSKGPLSCPEWIAQMQAEGLWQTTNGKTPVATLNASLHRELKLKGNASRFAKAERGKFKLVDKAT
jgi:hypothetical protein